MGLAKNIMGGGFSASQAASTDIAVSQTGISAAGTTQGTATALSADLNLVSTVAANSGVILYNGVINDSMIVYNDQAVNALLVYPPTSAQINQIPVNTAHSLPPNTFCEYYKVSKTRWVAQMSA